ncbi:hypothetical protein NWF32_28325 [Pseudomonas qingdaonensis]|nr:hypothetical protein [Pseudomonas qingdaonensis]
MAVHVHVAGVALFGEVGHGLHLAREVTAEGLGIVGCYRYQVHWRAGAPALRGDGRKGLRCNHTSCQCEKM